MCACMLQTLSKDRAFGHTLNRPFDGHASLPANVRIHNFHGTYGDYLICSIQHLIATTKRTLRSLYPALISTLSNVSPYIQNISPLASSRLLQLTTSFASPSFLLAEESNHRLLGILLDTVTSILYYQAPRKSTLPCPFTQRGMKQHHVQTKEACFCSNAPIWLLDNAHLVYALIQYEPKIQTMARFTLQRGLDDIHKLRYQKDDSSSATRSTTSTEGHMTKSVESRQRQRRGSQSHQSSHGESTPPLSQQPPRRPQLLKRERSTVEDTSPSSVPASSSGSVSMASLATFSPALTAAAEPNTLPLPLSPVMPPLFRPDSSDSIMAPPSDGGGHEGDVEDEGGPSTVLKSPKDRSINILSERARGKLPEKNQHHLQPSSPITLREDSSFELERQDARALKEKQSSSSLRAAATDSTTGTTTAPATTNSRRPTLTSHNSSYRHERPTTAFDVGQNGFVPTEEWVQEWMKTLRFEPLLIMLQCVIPEIESIQALNDQQVLQYIRTNIIPMLQQVLPESGRPPILVRKFTWTGGGNINSNNGGDEDLALVWWFEGLLWSQIYVGGCGKLGRQGLGAWYETGVRLFSIRTATSSNNTNATTVMAVTENMSTVAAAAIRAAGSTFATSSLGSGTSSPDSRTHAAATSGIGGAGSGAGGRRSYGQSNSSSSTRRPSSSSSVSTPTAKTGPTTSTRSASRKLSTGSISNDVSLRKA
ncbi:MAG: high-temperature-induced dauer-formation protein-domain-containing protein [Linnemannia elongata]|nr:MAG: high-temperature-induced dauer-formation protein-domain-containing protein [Linnemannia elongata]